MLKNIFSKVLVAILVTSVIATSAIAVTWNGLVQHPRTPVMITKYDSRLDAVKPSNDGQILWVDLAKQRLSLFKNKQFVTSYQILTGKDATPTPPGTYSIQYKLFKTNEGVRLQDANGKQTARVSYWMPFIGNDYAFHNASWRQSSEFGKISQRKFSGSGGCVNMSYSDVADLYNRINEGTVVHVTNK
jgi:lipoprotein-anchoring transpeptidase ErfK/SrfK